MPGKYRYRDRALQRGVKVIVVREHPKNPLGNPNGTFIFKAVMQDLDLSRVNTTTGVEVSVAAGSNLHTAFPMNCSLVSGKRLLCKQSVEAAGDHPVLFSVSYTSMLCSRST